ncbi:unnamed protein product [Cuscuta europaea]|uniref:Uncharacterized protein n=1 Tax=Cuscuta europaea TaxID=41803 RepID=A0A9P0Z5S7_CUSEU|nr:unnamed protein product [Cuscuta europaea]
MLNHQCVIHYLAKLQKQRGEERREKRKQQKKRCFTSNQFLAEAPESGFVMQEILGNSSRFAIHWSDADKVYIPLNTDQLAIGVVSIAGQIKKGKSCITQARGGQVH